MKTLLMLLMMFTISVTAQNKMDNIYFTWNDFTENFGKEMVSAEDVYASMVKNGLKENALIVMDFTFISDKKENLEKLSKFITLHYPYKIEKVQQNDDVWEINGITNQIPVTEDNMLFWVLDMYKRGYEFDARLDGYGGLSGSNDFPDLDKSQEDIYFEKGIRCYDKGDLSGAIINWSITLAINPKEPNAYYSRAIVKEELHTWKAALKDYDKAIELAPDFTSALVNRGSLKDDKGDYKGAIHDYNTAFKIGSLELEEEQMIYFNRGNSKYNLKDSKGACEDWQKAYQLGAIDAKDKLDKYCN